MGWVFTAWIGGILLIVSALMIAVYMSLVKEQFQHSSRKRGPAADYCCHYHRRGMEKVSVFDILFIERCKGGFQRSCKIIPYLVRGCWWPIGFSTALGYLTDGIAWLLHQTSVNTDFYCRHCPQRS